MMNLTNILESIIYVFQWIYVFYFLQPEILKLLLWQQILDNICENSGGVTLKTGSWLIKL